MVPEVLRAIGYTGAGQGLCSSRGPRSQKPSTAQALEKAIKVILSTLARHLFWLKMLGYLNQPTWNSLSRRPGSARWSQGTEASEGKTGSHTSTHSAWYKALSHSFRSGTSHGKKVPKGKLLQTEIDLDYRVGLRSNHRPPPRE